jgi:hypoxanthine phosphoribosyltransferase
VDANLTRFLSQEEITKAVKRLAGELDLEYRHRSPVVVGVLKGSFVFLADLVRQMKIPLASIEMIQVSSYGSGTVTSGRPRIIKGVPREVISGQDIIVVEDIVDTGASVMSILNYLKRFHPASIAVCALLDKPARREVGFTPQFVGFTIPDRFVVGYGLDLDQRYRELPEIYTLKQ